MWLFDVGVSYCEQGYLKDQNGRMRFSHHIRQQLIGRVATWRDAMSVRGCMISTDNVLVYLTEMMGIVAPINNRRRYYPAQIEIQGE